ncbi:protein arginine N-methyltransferase 1 [Ilumatobacter fluminis]|uniref:Protein arginine N-methyltransferase 1 n=1 Tax=Ilumatobacter fluminis TaxID=467091 RepID=A0A4R7I5B1_9ACTN|nr:methyltransferase domain-containing protein [Ilumatobacter fluminis]TDT18169.1 protein arginine N-methyltransferase 1 [Ilumatobacter fluminis]
MAAMGDSVQRASSKAIRSTMEFVATRIASSDRLMSIAYDLINGDTFAGLEAHEEMLSDTPRIEAYHRGIHRNVGPGDVVVDLGTGTGVLALMASKAGAEKVYAVEHSDVIEVAEEIARLNGVTNIEFVRANSREFVAPEPVDVILHEQMGDELFNENMLQNILDLRDRVLRPGGRILPGRFRLFVEPITLHDDMRIRRFWNIDLPDDIDLSGMERSPVAERFDAGRNDLFWLRPRSVAATVGAPQPVLEFDLADLATPFDLATSYTVERTATSDAIADGCAVWFEAQFDDETVLSTSPLDPVTSWGNRVFRLDRAIAAGDSLHIDIDLGVLVEPSTWQVRAR